MKKLNKLKPITIELPKEKELENKIYSNLKKREYLINSNFHGKLKDEKLLNAFKNEIADKRFDGWIPKFISKNQMFIDGCKDIINYEFMFLDKFMEILENFEHIQFLYNFM